MLVNGKFIGYTLELPWQKNLPEVSAITPNPYPLNGYDTFVRYDKGDKWRLQVPTGAVKGRTGIQIHIGNVPKDSTGCILIGKSLGPGQCQLRDSAAAYQDLRAAVGEPRNDTPVKLRVVGSPPESIVPNAPGMRRASDAGRARGGPIVDCAGASTTSARLKSGLGVFDDMIERTEAQIERARTERAAANAAASAALTDAAVSELQGALTEYISSAEIVQRHLEARRGARLSVSEVQALQDIEALKATSDELQRSLKIIVAVQDDQLRGQQLRNTAKQLMDHVARANRVFVESGVAESLGEGLAGALGGPLGEAAFKIAKLGIDVTTSLAQEALSTAEYQQARANLDIMQGQRSLVNGRIDRLDGLVRDNCSLTQQATISLTPPKKGGSKAGQTIAVGAAAAGGIVGAVAIKQYLDTLEYDTGNGGSTSSAGRCISNRICTVSALSGSCSCNGGSVYGACTYSGTPTAANGNCGGGIPCAAGLSCNNGRCEASNGRCPF